MKKVYSILIAIFKILDYISMGLLILWCIFLVLLYFASQPTKYESVHKGRYDDKKRIGLWEINSICRIDNDNDAKESKVGYYNKNGFKDGVWKIQAPYYSALFYYDNGIVKKAIKSDANKLSIIIFDEYGEIVSNMQGTKEECKILSKYFKEGYYMNDTCRDISSS